MLAFYVYREILLCHAAQDVTDLESATRKLLILLKQVMSEVARLRAYEARENSK